MSCECTVKIKVKNKVLSKTRRFADDIVASYQDEKISAWIDEVKREFGDDANLGRLAVTLKLIDD